MTVNKLYLEINCEFNHSSIVLNQIALFVRETFLKLRTQGTHYLFTLIVKTLKND